MEFLGVAHPQVHPDVCYDHEQLLLCHFQMLHNQDHLQMFVLGRSLEFYQVMWIPTWGKNNKLQPC